MRTRVAAVTAGVAVAVTMVGGCSDDDSPGWALPGPDLSALKVTGTKPVTKVGLPARLSPDGSRMFATVDGPCVLAPDGSDQQCVDDVPVDRTSARWSPDGTRLVFTDDFWRYFAEPDVWVFDVTSKVLRNLTDDGIDDLDIGDFDPNAKIDLLPSWSPDGKTVRFARGSFKSESMELMSVDAGGGGEPTSLGTIDCGTTQLVGLAWSTDRVAWSCGSQDAEVWLANQDGGDARTVLPAEQRADWMLLSFSADGRWLLADSVRAYTQFEPSAGMAKVVPVAGGEPVTVAEGEVSYPTWAPTGHTIAYVAPPGELYAVAEPGGEPRKLHSAERLTGAEDGRLGWVNGAMLVVVDGELTLLTLSS